MENGHLISEEVCKLLAKGAIKVVGTSPYSTSSLAEFCCFQKHVYVGQYSAGGTSKTTNQFMVNIHFKMESLNMMRDLHRQGDWMASKDAYLLVFIWEEHHKYLEQPAVQFQSLPFGLCSAPRVFT